MTRRLKYITLWPNIVSSGRSEIWLESVTKIINDNIGVANEQLNTTI
jgi:hypothetical protein